MKKLNVKQIIFDLFFEREITPEEKERTLKIVDIENKFVATLNEQQRAQYNELSRIISNNSIDYQRAIVDYVFQFFKEMFRLKRIKKELLQVLFFLRFFFFFFLFFLFWSVARFFAIKQVNQFANSKNNKSVNNCWS